MNMQQTNESEKELRLLELHRELDKIMLTADTEDFDQERLGSIIEEVKRLYPERMELAAPCDTGDSLKRFWERYAQMQQHRYSRFYNLVVQEEIKLKKMDPTNNYRHCKALAACYELQDYLAGVLADYPEE